MKLKSNLRFSSIFPLATAIAAMVSVASAANLTWDAGGGGDPVTDGGGAWLDAGFWNDASAAVTWTSGDDAIFGNAGAGGAVTLAIPTVVNSLTLNSFTGTYTLGTAGQTITLTNGITKNTGAGAATIVSPITLGAAQSWTNNSTGLLTIGTDAVNNGGFLLTSGGTGNTTISSAIGGIGGLAKQGAGLLTLTGSNNYGGGTNITAGLVKFTSVASMPTTGGIGVSSGAGLIVDVNGAGRFAATGTGAGTFAGILTGVGAGGNTITYTGDVTVGIDISVSGAVTYAGVIANATGSTNTSIHKFNGQNLTLTGANTYSGKTILGGGSVVVSSFGNVGDANSPLGTNSTIDFLSTGNLTFAGTTVQTSNKTLNIAQSDATIRADGTGLGAITLSAPVNPTSATNKTLSLFGANTNANTISGNISNGAGGVLSVLKNLAGTWVLSGTNTYTGNTTINGGTLVYRNLASKATSGTHNFAAGTTLGLGVGGVNFTTGDVDNAFSGTMTGNLSNVTVNAATNIGIDTTAGNLTYSSDIGAVARGLTKLGANTLTLGSNNAYTGVTTLAGGGTLTVGTLANAGANSSIGAFPTAGATGLILSGGTFNYTGASTTTDRGFTVNGATKSTISVGTGVDLNLGASVKNETASSTNGLTFNASGAGSSITISSLTITAGSNPDFNITGSNPTVTIQNLNVSGANVIAQRTGTALLNVGTITGTGASGWLSNMNVTGQISGYTGTVILGADVTLTGLSTFDTNVFVQQGGIYRFNSIKNVGGGASALGAPTTVANGTISIGNFTNNPTFRYTGSGDATNRVLNLRGGATITIEQAGTGLLHFTGNTTADTGNTGAKTLNFSGSTTGTGEFSGVIVEHTTTNKTSVSKSGTGTWTLSGANVYTGNTTVNGGKLLINNTTGSGTGTGTVSVASGATLGGTGTIGGDTSIADNGKLEFNLSTAPGSHDKLDLAAGKALSFGANATLTITSSSGATTGLYTLVTAPGGVGTLPAFTVNLPPGWSADPPAIVSGTDLVLNITSTGGSAYDIWKAANAPGSNPGDDTDGDGVTNALEFVLGGTSATKDLNKLPTTATGVTDMTFTFNRAVSSIDPKTALFIETSTDLVTWNTAPSPYSVPNTAVANNPGVTVVEDTSVGFDTVTLTVPKAPDAKKFARLKVVITP